VTVFQIIIDHHQEEGPPAPKLKAQYTPKHLKQKLTHEYGVSE